MSLESVRNADYGYFRPARYSDLDLKRIVDLVPDNEAAERTFQAYANANNTPVRVRMPASVWNSWWVR
jgi:hypothetical protein